MASQRGPTPWSLRGILFAQLVLVALAPLIAVAVFMLVKIEPQLYEDVNVRQLTLARGVIGQVETHLASAERELQSLASSLAVERNDQNRIPVDHLLDAVVRKGELYEAIYLVDASAGIVSLGLPLDRRNARDDLRSVDLSRRDFVTAALTQGEVVWSRAFLSAVSGRLTVALAIPVKGGAIVGELALSQLSFFLRSLRSDAGTYSLVVDSLGHLIAHPLPGKAGQQISLNDLDLIRAALNKGEAFGKAKIDEKPVLASVLKIEKTGWAVMIAQTESLAHQMIDLIEAVFFFGFMFALVLATVSAAWVSRSMAGKFGAYATNAGLMARGIYDLIWPKTKVKEFIDLARDLQNTADEIQRRELALRESEERLLATLESTPNVAIQWFDSQGRVVYWNKSSETLYGVTAENAMARRLDELIYTKEEGEAFLQMLAGIAADGQAVGPYEAAFRRPDGMEGVILCTTFSIPGERGDHRFVCMDIDVTQQKRLTEELAQRERCVRALVEQSPVAVIEWDLNFRVSEWNQAAEHVFGYSRSDALGQHALFIVPKESHPIVDQIWDYLRTNSGGSHSENDNITADGRRILCQWHNRPIVNDDGELVSVVSLVEDVSERRRIEQALKASEQKFLSLFHGSPVAVAVSRYSDAIPFTDCNEAWQRQFGWSRQEIFGKTGIELGLWVDESQRLALLDNLARQESVHDMEVTLRRRDGRLMACLMSGRGIGVDGEKLVVFSYHDVTDERKTQQEIRDLNATLEQRVDSRTAALAAANKELTATLETLHRAQDELVRTEKMASLGSLVAGVAHELNTPIGNSLMAMSTFDEHSKSFQQILSGGGLKRSALDQYVEDAATAASIILRNLQKASELVSSFKQVAVDQSGSQRRGFLLEEVVAEILLTLRPTFRRTPYTVTSNINDDISMNSFPGPLGQVITNLINNALIHAFEGREQGAVILSASRVGSDVVRIEVVDDGKGIAQEHLGRIFDPFFTTKLGRGGSGLGLHIVYNIVTRVLGGRIGVISNPAGSTFWLEIPLFAPDQGSDIHL